MIGFVVVELELQTAAVVATPERAVVVDRPMSMSPLDETAFVPMSGLIGSLRAHITGSGGDADELLGPPVLKDGEPAVASRVRGLGTVTTLGDGAVARGSLELREQTAIDDERAGAAAKTLYSTTLVPAGTCVTAYFEVRDMPYAQAVAVRSVADLTVLLGAHAAGWEPVVGAGESVGLGRARTVSVRHGTADPGDPKDLLALLTLPGPEQVAHFASTDVTIEAGVRESWRSYELEIATALLVSPTVELSADHPAVGGGDPAAVEARANTMVALQRGGDYVIDGSSLKGVLRHRVGFVLRTLELLVPELTLEEVEWAVDSMFGRTSQRGWLTFTGTTIREAQIDDRTHVAVDRVTGGAHDTLLFKDRPVTKGKFVVEVDTTGLVGGWVGEVLDAAVIDLHDGLAGIGSATSRGYGTVRCFGDPPVRVAGRSIVEGLRAAYATLAGAEGPEHEGGDRANGASE